MRAVALGETPRPPARVAWLGRRRYEPVHALQKRLVEARGKGAIGDVILLVEHEPVITLGRAADPANVLFGAEALLDFPWPSSWLQFCDGIAAPASKRRTRRLSRDELDQLVRAMKRCAAIGEHLTGLAAIRRKPRYLLSCPKRELLRTVRESSEWAYPLASSAVGSSLEGFKPLTANDFDDLAKPSDGGDQRLKVVGPDLVVR